MHTFFYCTHFPTLQKNLDIFNTSKNFGHFQHFKKIWTFSTLQKNLGISRTCKIFEDFRHNFSKSFGFLSHHEIFILQNLFTLETVKPRKLLHCLSYHINHDLSSSRWSDSKISSGKLDFFFLYKRFKGDHNL